MAQASLDDDEVGEDDFQTLHTPVHHMVRWDGGGWGWLGEPAMEQMEASRGSPAWWSFVQVDIGEEQPETLGEIDPHWRAQWWLQVAIQDIMDEEVPWHELLAPLTLGAEGVARSLAKHLSLHGSGTSRCGGRASAHPPPPSSILVSLLQMRRQ